MERGDYFYKTKAIKIESFHIIEISYHKKKNGPQGVKRKIWTRI